MDTNKQLKYTNVTSSPLVKAFSKQPDLKSFIHWVPTWSEKKQKVLKVPVQKINNSTQHLDLQQALSSDKHNTLGLVFNPSHRYIALDVDGVNPHTTPSLYAFLKEHPTYQEYSPSGKPHRTRLIYQLFSLDDKTLLKPKTKVIPSDQTQSNPAEIELFSSSNNYTTLTGQETKDSTHNISLISTTDLIQHFPKFKAQSQVIPINEEVKEKLQQDSRVASLVPAKTWINTVPLHRDDSSLNQIIDRHQLTYYEFWLQGIMCIHSAWGTITGFQYADEWSQKSDADYDQGELKEKWDSFDDKKESKVTRATYQWIFSLFSIDWPVTSGIKVQKPKVTELDNFKAFLTHQGLTIDRDAISLTYFLSGQAATDVYPRYYNTKAQSFSVVGADVSRLAARLQTVGSNYQYRPSHANIEEFMKTIIAQKFPEEYTNRFADEIATRPHYDPHSEPDYFTLMSRSIIQRNPENEHPTKEFHDLLVRKWLLSLGRSFWPNELSRPFHRDSSAEGILILSDKSITGGINKSSLGIRLFPKEWQHLYAQTYPGRVGKDNQKEYLQETIKSCLVDWDEVDAVIGKSINNATLKSLITSKADSLRLPYDRDYILYPRRYSLIASTNKADLLLPEEGVRRFWWLNVNYIDTYKLDTWDMYNLWRQIRYELSHYDTTPMNAPWTLTNEEKKYLESYLSDHRSTSSLKEYLLDKYNWTEQGFIDHQEAVISQADKGQITLNSNNTLAKHATVGLNELQSSIESRQGNTKQLKHTIQALVHKFAPDEIYFKRTCVKKGLYTFQGQQRYLMPAERNDELMREAAQLD